MAINTSPITAAVAPQEPVVTQNAAAGLANAFRQGQVSAQEIIDRVRQRSMVKAKEKAAQVEAEEFVSPEAAESRKAERGAKKAKAELDIATAPLAAQAADAKLKADIYDAQLRGSGVEDIQKVLTQHGWPVVINPQKGVTEQDRQEIMRRFQVLQKYVAAKTKAADVAEKAKADFEKLTVTTPEGQIVEGRSKDPFVVYQGQQVSPDKFKRAVQFHQQMQTMTPAAYDALGQPEAPSVFDVAPGTTVQPQQPTDSVIQPRLPGPVGMTPAAPVADAGVEPEPQLGQPFDQMGAVTSIKPGTPRTPTDPQQRAQLALPRFTEAEDIMGQLAQRGFNATSVGSWLGGMAPEILKPDNVKLLDVAKRAWSQGLLRLESGAAISIAERKDYEKAFFPLVGDSPEVVAAKDKLRADVAQVASEIAGAGNVATDAVKRQAEEIKQRAAAVAAGSAGGAVETKQVPGGTMTRDASGVYKFTPSSKAPGTTPTTPQTPADAQGIIQPKRAQPHPTKPGRMIAPITPRQ